MRHVILNPRIFTDKEINPMDEFGIGANMVKALRYWLQATGLTVEHTGSNRHQQLTEFGEQVWNNDPYLEEDGTLFLIHYFLASNHKLATAWYYFFNHYKVIDITEESFVAGIKSYLLDILKEGEALPADRALTDDFDCIIKTYTPNTASSPESNMGCPLSDLSLVATTERAKYVKVNTKASAINPLIILAVIINENANNESKEIKISNLENAPCNIGKIFNLDALTIATYLDKLQNMEYITVNRTAGLDIITLRTEMDFIQCIQAYYRSIND
jgi:hypothetical protein